MCTVSYFSLGLWNREVTMVWTICGRRGWREMDRFEHYDLSNEQDLVVDVPSLGDESLRGCVWLTYFLLGWLVMLFTEVETT